MRLELGCFPFQSATNGVKFKIKDDIFFGILQSLGCREVEVQL